MSIYTYYKNYSFRFNSMSNVLIFYHTVPTRPNLTSEQTLTIPWVYFRGLLWVLLWVYSGFAFEIYIAHLSVKQTCLLSFTACKSHLLYIPNTNVASAFRDELCICYSKPGVNQKQTPKVNPGLSWGLRYVRLGLVGTVPTMLPLLFVTSSETPIKLLILLIMIVTVKYPKLIL